MHMYTKQSTSTILTGRWRKMLNYFKHQEGFHYTPNTRPRPSVWQVLGSDPRSKWSLLPTGLFASGCLSGSSCCIGLYSTQCSWFKCSAQNSQVRQLWFIPSNPAWTSALYLSSSNENAYRGCIPVGCLLCLNRCLFYGGVYFHSVWENTVTCRKQKHFSIRFGIKQRHLLIFTFLS